MTIVGTERLRELIAGLREESDGGRAQYYELFGSAIQPVLLPLAKLLEANLESNPELVELVLLNLAQDFRGSGSHLTELWEKVDAVSIELPDYFAPKPMSSSIEGSLDSSVATDSPALWRFHWPMGRQGDVEGVFVATHGEIKAALGLRVYFGDILGKHSDVHGMLEEQDLTMLTDDPTGVASFQRYVRSTGYNPLEYLEEEEED